MSRPSRRALLVAGLSAALPAAACSSPSTDAAGSPALSGPTGTAASGAPATSGPAPGSSPSGAPASTAASTASASVASVPRGSGSALAAGPDITHGPRTTPAVALTFHGAGDAGILRDMLAVLRDGGDAKVTVLAIGQWLAAEPALARTVLDAGHDLGNHTWSHKTMPRLSAADTRAEIDRAAAELRTLTGGTGRWFRPSGTPTSTPTIRSAAVAAGYGACLAYDVDPLDYTDPGAATIVRNVARDVKPGSIVSLHLGHAGTLQAMPQILQTLRDKGLRAVTASQLLGVR